MKARSLFVTALIATGLVFTSCEKNDEAVVEQPLDEEAIVQEDTEMDEILDGVAEQVDVYTALDIEGSYAEESTLKSSMEDVEYPIVTREHLVEGQFYPVRITVDYGPENHKILVHRTKEAWVRGKIIIEKTGPHYVPNTERTVTFDEFYFNDNNIEGDKVYENLGRNDDGNFVFAWSVDVKITTPEGKWRTRIENKQREKIAGTDTPRNIWDDEFLITGSTSGSDSEGFSYNRTIVEDNPLWRKRVCRFPVKGTISIVNTNRSFTLDYGDGECDALATITDSEGNTKEIVLGRR
ncbi:MAG: hypothetical protein GXO47_13355 [Chlorobi bacterium]|nr:hypothetical protein [Chlorobiota bacterium]